MDSENNVSAPLPTASQIERSLPAATGTPMDFMKEMLERPSSSLKVDGQRVTVDTKVEEPVKIEEPVKPIEQEGLENITLSEELPAVSEGEVEEADEYTSTILPEKYKSLKTAYKESKNKYKEVETKAQELERKIQEYDSGIALPKVVEELTEKVEKLSKYQQIYDLKGSDYYRQKFIEPVSAIKDEILKKGEEYNIPSNIMEQALALDKRDLSAFLNDHFDEDEAYNIRQKVKEMRSVQTQALEAEKEPARVMEELNKEFETIESQKIQERAETFTNVSKDAWLKSLQAIRDEKKALELIPRPNDEKFNNDVVRPLLRAASTEFGKIVKELTKAGLKELTPDLAYALANMTQRAVATSVSFETRDFAIKEANELSEMMTTNSKYERLPVGRTYAAPSSAPKPMGNAKDSIAAGAEATLQAGRIYASSIRK